MKRNELTERRNAYTKIFENQDHSHTAEIYLNPVHYEDDNGKWKEMDDSLEELTEIKEDSKMRNVEFSKYGFTNKKGKFEVFFAKTTSASNLVILKQEKNNIAWSLDNSNFVEAVRTEKNTICYPEILEGINLCCSVRGMQVKEDIVLTRKGPAKSYAYIYDAKGFVPVQKGKKIVFYDKDGMEVFCVQTPYMQDAAGIRTDAIQLSTETLSDGKCKIIFTPDSGWLEKENRIYPVVIDPVTTTSKEATDIEDAYISSLNEEDNFYNNENLWLKGGDEIRRSFLKFKLPEIQTGDMIIKARLVLVSLGTSGAEKTIAVHKVIQGWDSKYINWYNKPIYEETIQDLCKFKSDEIKYVTLDITRMVKEWYRDGSNNGLMLKELDELTGTIQLMSSDWDSSLSDYRPRVEISYVNYSGLEDYWTYHSQEVGRAGEIHVNDYNGNLILVHPVMMSGGSRMPVAVSFIYNTNDKDTDIGYGKGIRLNYHQTIRKKIIADTVYYAHTDSDGTVHYFREKEVEKDGKKEKAWVEENGLDLTLIRNIGSEEPYVIKDKNGTCLVFDSNGLLIAVRDKNENKIAITYSDKRIKAIMDGAGRVFTLTYSQDSDGNNEHLIQIVSPAGEKKVFAYSDGNLISVTDVDSKRITYTYDNKGLLTSAMNVNGYQVKYTYYTAQPYRVKTVTEYANGEKGNSLSLIYGYNSTKFTDNKNRVEVYRFDNNGNLLHIHDGFGRAVSGKYNLDGNHVNRLENATKLQNNVVQLLKDPIIQAKTIGWTSVVSAEEDGSAEVNTKAANCMVGDRSLKAECTSLTGYAYWQQNVQVKKGSTYTTSIYVKASVTDTSDNGGVMLRVRYLDKDGAKQFINSEVLKKSTNGFVRLTSTFTIPKDASSDVVRIYIGVWRAKASIYADMAQMETGTTANRCNLIDNGDFHLGSAEGFSRKGSAIDGLAEVGIADNIPIQTALLVTASSGVLRKTPSTSAAVVMNLTKHQHITGHIITYQDGKNWYYAETSDGTKGYVLTSQAIPYLGGHEGVNSGAVAVGNAILYASADKTSSRVQEGISKGTCVALSKTVEGTDGNTWYYIGMQIDKERYFGYMPASDIIRLCRNIAKVEVKTDTGYYSSRDMSKTSAGTIAAGTRMAFRGTSVDANGKEWRVIRRGAQFYFVPSEDLEVKTAGAHGRLSNFTVEESVANLDSSVYRFIGEPTMDKKLVKTLDIAGKKGDTYMVNAWGLGTTLPETDNDTDRRFGTEVTFVAVSGENDVHYTNFSPDIQDWQFLSDVYVAKKDYSSIQIAYTYCHNANMAYFDGMALYREGFGNTYTYDENNDLIAVTDLQEQTMKFEYNSQSDVIGITDAKGNKFTYEYDDEKTTRNVIKGTSAQNVMYRFTYDTAGNVLKSACVDPGAQQVGTWMTRVMTSDKNHVKTITDANGNIMRYTWDTTKDLLTSVQDARGNKTTYTYDALNRLLSTSQSVTVNGSKQTIKNTYSYTNDDLTEITHNGFVYGFAHDAFGKVTSASIAGNEVISYKYESSNGRLLKLLYGNGSYIRYTYDKQDRVIQSYLKNSEDSTEQKLYGYQYDKQGNLCTVTSDLAGKTYYLFYDLLDRLMRVTDEQGNAYEYTYDTNNNMVSLIHTCGTSALKTAYTYDKDNREIMTKCASSYERTTVYDEFGRVSKRSWSTTSPYTSVYTYIQNGDNRYSLPEKIKNGAESISYTYDENANITSIMDAVGQSTFQYDEMNQLIRENNHQLNKTITYTYDLGGNLIEVKEYAFTTAETLSGTPVKTMTGTYDSVWKDQLLNWNDMVMTYDAVGNMLTKGDINYIWTQGRKLSGVENGKSIQYLYDHTGARVKKTVDETQTEYRWAGELLLSEKTGMQTMWYRYDSAGSLVAVTIKGKIYFYVRNAQNDIIALVDADGKIVVQYTYDSWGKVVSITGEMADTVGVQNPFRYKGYYYDHETGMYYVKNRYYDPEIKRFICADELKYTLVSPEDHSYKNLYVYCDNNPYIREDSTGKIWNLVLHGAIGAAVNVMYCGFVAKVTGQSYSIRDIKMAAFSGAASGAISAVNPNFERIGSIIGGLISAIYTMYTIWDNDGTAAEIAISGVLSYAAATSVGDLSRGIGGNELPKISKHSFEVVYNTGVNLTSSAINAGIIVNAEYRKNKSSNAVKNNPATCIRKGCTSNSTSGIKWEYYKTSGGKFFKAFQ